MFCDRMSPSCEYDWINPVYDYFHDLFDLGKLSDISLQIRNSDNFNSDFLELCCN